MKRVGAKVTGNAETAGDAMRCDDDDDEEMIRLEAGELLCMLFIGAGEVGDAGRLRSRCFYKYKVMLWMFLGSGQVQGLVRSLTTQE